ncbi:MAG: hypothetical protein COV47_05815 [Candidatus Diapherotrites archaeon CG11_big_fil_rev_8_21_14_0_20_37_9]|nr:MAG: hypothetical protein COV47_05815 [Candidatus Diapherotrites archaeon CG11_big_fil_rev_8_21_14_0_20_37_9]
MELEKEINLLKERNKKVEADKAWETSKTRRLILALSTYFIVYYFLTLINSPDQHFVSLVPAGAYLLQQYSMPFLKKIWAQRFHKN